MAMACFFGRPARISVRILALTVLREEPRLSGIRASLPSRLGYPREVGVPVDESEPEGPGGGDGEGRLAKSLYPDTPIWSRGHWCQIVDSRS